MLDGKQLRKLFIAFNAQHWGGKLSQYRIRRVAHITWLGESGRCDRKGRVITIARGMDDPTTVTTLLHEMAHAATTGHHGLPWKREMIRLRKAGAPLISPDSEVALEDWSGARITKGHFSSTASDLSLDLPQATAQQCIRHFISEVGGPTSIAAFLRKYPWAPRTFTAVKKEMRAGLRRKPTSAQ
jgi:hypothetical protein